MLSWPFPPPAQAIDREIEVARLRSSSGVSRAFRRRPVHPLFEVSETYDEPPRLEADTHLIAIISARQHEAVDAGAHEAAQDCVRFGHRWLCVLSRHAGYVHDRYKG